MKFSDEYKEDILSTLSRFEDDEVLSVHVFEDNLQYFAEPQLFKNKETLIEALRNLKNVEFNRVINSSISFVKNDKYYDLQISGLELEDSLEID